MEDDIAAADGVVNATQVGMRGFPGNPVPVSALRAAHWGADVIYTPIETDFIKAAAAKGARVMNGGGMCVHQAVEAFRLFTGERDSRACIAPLRQATRRAKRRFARRTEDSKEDKTIDRPFLAAGEAPCRRGLSGVAVSVRRHPPAASADATAVAAGPVGRLHPQLVGDRPVYRSARP